MEASLPPAMIASALMFLMMAASVEKAIDLMRFPKMRMPLHSLMQCGSVSPWLRSVPL